MIYLDYNSTAPYSSKVVHYLQNGVLNDWHNASSEHDLGHLLSGRIKNDRWAIADFLDCSTGKLFFTSGATESINSVLSSDNINSHGIQGVITSPLEHYATLACCNNLKEKGLEILHVKHDQFGNINLDDLESLCKKNKKFLVSLLFVNNETGVISPVKNIVKITHKYNSLVHIDAVQALGKYKFSLDDLDADFASFSGHKIGSFKGIGLIYINQFKKFKPFILGGGQERNIRAGTYNFSAIHSLKLAIEDIDFKKNKSIQALRDIFEKKFLEIDKSFKINGINAPRVSNTSNIYLGGQESREVMLKLAARGISISTGSACSSGSVKPSHVISSMGGGNQVAISSLRVSIGTKTSNDELNLLINTLEKITPVGGAKKELLTRRR